jgi:hypothetical protein
LAAIFGVRNDGNNDVFVVFDFEVKSSIPRGSGLPQIRGFAAFLGPQRGMAKVGKQKAQLLGECLADN